MAIYVLSNNYREPAKCVIHVGSPPEEIIAVAGYISELKVECYRDEASSAVLRLEARRSANGQRTAWSSDIFIPGEPILVQAIFGNRTEEVLRGYIADVKTKFLCKTFADHLTVHCQDESFPLGRTPVQRMWGREGITNDRLIVATILAKYGITLDPASGQGLNVQILQQEATDRDFLKERAALNAYELLFREGHVYFGPLRWDMIAQPAIEVHGRAGAHCRRFLFCGSNYWWGNVLFDSAQGELDGSRYGHVLQVGRPVVVTGLVGDYGGKYYVDSIIHSFTKDRYHQHFKLIRNAPSKTQHPPIDIDLPRMPSLLYEVL
jgi:hypothetical protein